MNKWVAKNLVANVRSEGFTCPGSFCAFSRFVGSEASEKTRLLTALPWLPSDPWLLMFPHPDLASIAISSSWPLSCALF